jgi:hypothetical protein
MASHEQWVELHARTVAAIAAARVICERSDLACTRAEAARTRSREGPELELLPAGARRLRFQADRTR